MGDLETGAVEKREIKAKRSKRLPQSSVMSTRRIRVNLRSSVDKKRKLNPQISQINTD